jgi:MFS family permease
VSELRESPVPWASPAAPAPPSEPGPFRIRGFWWIWILSGLAGATLGAYGTIYTHAVTDVDISFRSFSAIPLSGHVGVLLGTVLSLSLADRFPKKRAISLCYFAMAVCCTAAFFVALTGLAPVALLLVSSGIVGVLYGLSAPMIWGVVAELIPRAVLAKGLVMLSWSGLIATALGVLAGFMLFSEPLWDAPHEFVFLYVAFLAGLTGLLTKRLPQYAGNARFSGGFRDALSSLIGARRLRALWLYVVVVSGCLAVFSSSVGVFAYLDLDRSQDLGHLGLLYLAQGGAAVIATIGLAFVISGKHGWPILLVCSGIAAVLCILIAVAETFWPLLGLMIPFGAASGAATLAANAIAMSHTRFGYFGRVAGLLLIGGSLSAAGIAFLGVLVGSWGQGRSMVVASGVVFLVASVFLYRTWISTRHDSSPTDGVARTPSTGLIAEIASPQKSADPNQSA